jgi:hypothetical protein
MKRSDAFPSKYLACADLDEEEMELIIDRVQMEELKSDEGDQRKPVLYFQNMEKGMVCNFTNWGTIEYAYGEDSDNWIGKPIVLYPTTTQFKGRTVPTIRVRVPKPVTRTVPRPTAAQPSPRITTGRQPIPGDRGADEPPEWEPPR